MANLREAVDVVPFVPAARLPLRFWNNAHVDIERDCGCPDLILHYNIRREGIDEEQDRLQVQSDFHVAQLGLDNH